MQASRQGDGHQGVRGSSCANAAPRSWFGEVNVVALPRAPGAEGDCEMGLHDAEGPGVHRDAAKREARSGASATGSEASMPSMLSGMDVVPPPRGAAGASRPDGIEGNAPAAEFRAGVLPWRSMNARHSAHSRALDQAVAAGKVVRSESGFHVKESASNFTCQVCYDTFEGVDEVAANVREFPSCGHAMCKGCWFQQLKTQIIDEGVSVKIACPGFTMVGTKVKRCNIILDERFVEKLLKEVLAGGAEPDAAGVLKRYQKQLNDNYVNNNHCIKWCPVIRNLLHKP